MIVQALERFGIDLSEDARAEAAGQILERNTDSEIEIDFSGCILDYVATSKVIAGALRGLSKAKAPRTLVLVFNIAFQERMFIKWFFFGGELLAEDQYNADVSILRDHISASLRQRGVVLHIRIRNPKTNHVTDAYAYG